MLQFDGGFPPFCTGFQPEYLGGHVAVLGSVKEITGDLGVCLGFPKIQFLAIMLAQGFGINSHDTTDIGFRNAVGSERLHLPAQRGIGLVGASSHQAASEPRRSAATSANDRSAPSNRAS